MEAIGSKTVPSTSKSARATTSKRGPEWMEAIVSKDVSATSKDAPAQTLAIRKEVGPVAKKSKPDTEKENRPGNEIESIISTIYWKKSIVDLEKKKFEMDEQKRQLQCYNLALQNMAMERQLGTWFSLRLLIILHSLKCQL